MELIARLEPRVDPNEVLVDGLSERKTMELTTNGETTSLILGRGADTGIADGRIEEAVVEISFDDFSRDEQTVKATLLKRNVGAHINGHHWCADTMGRTWFLSTGDVISLDDLRYEYRLHISEHIVGEAAADSGTETEDDAISISSGTPPSSPKTKAAPAPSEKPAAVPAAAAAAKKSITAAAAIPEEGSITISKDTASRLSDEIHCSVCLEIQVYPRTLDPCGHSFCNECLQRQLENCPQCRVEINSHVPAMQLDSLISMLVSVPSLLNQEDVKHYHERKEGSKVAPVVYHKQRRKRQRTDPPTDHHLDLANPLAAAFAPSERASLAFAGPSHRWAAPAARARYLDLGEDPEQSFMPASSSLGAAPSFRSLSRQFAAERAERQQQHVQQQRSNMRAAARAANAAFRSQRALARAATAAIQQQEHAQLGFATGTSSAPISIDDD